jgi:hypothetical protein
MKTLLTLETEVWYQDREDGDYWHGKRGIIVNTAALNEREVYYEIIRVHTCTNNKAEHVGSAYA